MKRSELQVLINECIQEVINEKTSAIQQIKNIIKENQLTEEDVEEGLGDVFRQTLGIASKKAKEDFEKQVADTNKERKEKGLAELTPRQLEFLSKKAQGYALIGKIIDRTKENPNWAGEQAAPATGRTGMFK
jgi:hypothetical protein